MSSKKRWLKREMEKPERDGLLAWVGRGSGGWAGFSVSKVESEPDRGLGGLRGGVFSPRRAVQPRDQP